MATQYTLNIAMDDATVNSLAGENFSLYAFKAVQTNIGGGQPVVWFKTKEFSLSTVVTWSLDFGAYTSKTQIIANANIVASASYPINLGQILEVQQPTGTGAVKQDGTDDAISIYNKTNTPFTCGISVKAGNSSNAICAFPLHGESTNVIVPIEKVLVMFASDEVNTGTVIEKAFTSSFLVDMTGATDNTRQIKYDINASWNAGGAGWANKQKPNVQLAPLLILSK
jgi:hypothetical protein